jgi:hypothetical protein
MATDLKSHAQGVSLTRFWGGDNRGSCVQLTQKKQQLPATSDKFFDSLQLTRAQAAALAADLMDFAQGREQELLEEMEFDTVD